MPVAATIDELLDAWEATYKKGQLTLWVFLALDESRKYAGEIKAFVETQTAGAMTCELQSLYRVLRKYQHVGVVDFELQAGQRGPDRKYYALTPLGRRLLVEFTRRNIGLFFSNRIHHQIKKLIA